MAYDSTLSTAGQDELSRRPRDPVDFVRQMDDDKLSCRSEGHRFPKLRPGRTPRGISIVRFRDGSYQMNYVCADCGTEKTRITLPGGGYDAATRNRYTWPRGYKSPPRSGLSKGHFVEENDRRVFATRERYATDAPAEDETPEDAS